MKPGWIHLEELRRRVLRSLLVLLLAAGPPGLALARPLVKLVGGSAEGMRSCSWRPGEFLFVSSKVAGYAGLSLPSLKHPLRGAGLRSARPDARGTAGWLAPAVAGSAVLFPRWRSPSPGGPGAGPGAPLPGGITERMWRADLVDRALIWILCCC